MPGPGIGSAGEQGNALWAIIATGISSIVVFGLRWLKDINAAKVKAQAGRDKEVQDRAISDGEISRKLRDELRADLVAAEAKIDRLQEEIERLEEKDLSQRRRILDLEGRLLRRPPSDPQSGEGY